MTRPVAAVTLLLAVAAAAGCMGGEAAIDAASARRLVLQAEDVPRVFQRFDFGPIARADLPAGERADPARFGREAGWKARYRRAGTAETRGPLVVESLVDVFGAAGGAEDELAAIREELEQPPGPAATPTTILEAPELGDEAVSWSSLLPAQPRNTVFFTVAWRRENVVAAVSVNGFEGRVAASDALELARSQDARLRSAD